MIYIQPEHKLIVTFTNTTENSDIATFMSIMNKCAKEARKSGFKSIFDTEEKDFIKALHDNLNDK